MAKVEQAAADPAQGHRERPRHQARRRDRVGFAGEIIRTVPARGRRKVLGPAERVRLLDLATARQRKRQRGVRPAKAQERGWTREELYERGRAR